MSRLIRAVITGPELHVPMMQHALCAGFPSPADDYLEEAVDVARLLVTNPAATYLWRVDGHSMRDAGIFDRDLLIVDRSLEARDRDVVVAIVNGERSLKRLRLRRSMGLAFENREMPEFDLPEVADVEIWGVVTYSLHRHRNSRP